MISLGFFVLISIIQARIFLPNEYIMWIFKSPFKSLIFIYELYIIFGFFCIFNKDLRRFIRFSINAKSSFIKRKKILFISSFVTINIVLIYTILFNVTVISNSNIVNYTFLSPKGKEYSYKDIVKIETGVYGKKSPFLSTGSKGEFYYIIQLSDGTKIDLAEVGGTMNEEDPRFIIERLDREYVNRGISKVSSMENFEYCTKYLDKIYTDKIRNILENTR